jgi:hypothetical protein
MPTDGMRGEATRNTTRFSRSAESRGGGYFFFDNSRCGFLLASRSMGSHKLHFWSVTSNPQQTIVSIDSCCLRKCGAAAALIV